MEWQAVVLAVQILLLAAGWLLFQRARGELSVRAAEAPVLAEVRALQKSVKQLLVELESAADRQAARLETACSDAGAVLSDLESRVTEADLRVKELKAQLSASREITVDDAKPAAHAVVTQQIDRAETGAADAAETTPAAALATRQSVYLLADSGQTAAQIARTTELSEGEIETLLGLRAQR